jgi:hypothetical protein
MLMRRSIAERPRLAVVRAAESGWAAKSGHARQVRAPVKADSRRMNTLTDAQRERVLALLREGKTLRRIEQETGHRRETIAAYGRRAGLLGGEVADLDAVRAPISICEPHEARIAAALENGASLRAVHAELVARYGFAGSYSTLKRFVRTQRLPLRGTGMMLAA